MTTDPTPETVAKIKAAARAKLADAPNLSTQELEAQAAVYGNQGYVEKLHRLLQKKLPVVEIFGPTVQGEGIMIGRPTFFVRFGLCDYRCKLCDSMHAVDPQIVAATATWLTQQEIAATLLDAMGHIEWVTFSGGNPCVHDLTGLVHILHKNGKKVAVETQGTHIPAWLNEVDQITVSPKGPGMGEKFERDKFERYLAAFGSRLCVKVVVFSPQDLEFVVHIRGLLSKHYLVGMPIYLSLGNPFAVSGKALAEDEDPHASTPQQLVDLRSTLLEHYHLLLEEINQDPRLGEVIFLPQLHVLVWGNKLGV